MTQVKSRGYEMSNRARQAQETRVRIVEAAARLFVRDGYSATSINAIADEAGVAAPTVYASLRSKANILRAVVKQTVRGDDDSPPLSARPEWERIEREADPREQLALFAHLHNAVAVGLWVQYAIIRAAVRMSSAGMPVISETRSGE